MLGKIKIKIETKGNMQKVYLNMVNDHLKRVADKLYFG